MVIGNDNAGNNTVTGTAADDAINGLGGTNATLSTATAMLTDDTLVYVTEPDPDSVPQGDSPESPGLLTFTIFRSGDTSAASTVGFTVSGSGTLDYYDTDIFIPEVKVGNTVLSAVGSIYTVLFQANETSIAVVIANGGVFSGNDLTVTLTLVNAIDATLGSPSSATGTFLDDATLVSISGPDSVSVPEGDSADTAGVLTFTVSRTGDTSGSNTVSFTVEGSTGSQVLEVKIDGAVVPEENGAYSFTFAPTDQSKMVQLIASADTIPEFDQSVSILLVSGGGAAISDTSDFATGTFINDDEYPTVTLSGPPAPVNEGDPGPDGGAVAFTMVRTGQTDYDPIARSGGGVLDFTIIRTGQTDKYASIVSFTLGGTASSGDIAQVKFGSTVLTPDNGVYTVTIPAGTANAVISVIANGDLTPESSETVTITLGQNPVNATLGNITEATGTFLNDDTSIITGTSRADRLTGTALGDRIDGLAGDDRLTGLGGNDTLDGGTGGDTMDGGAGDDTFIVDNSRDRVIEAADGGYDQVETSLTRLTLAANVEDLTYTGTRGFTGTGNEGANRIIGAGGADTLSGAGGNDQLYGFGGADRLSGGSGNDWLDGGAGADRLSGGLGNDTFIFDAADMVGKRTVVDGDGGFDLLAVAGATTVNLTGARVAEIEAVVVSRTDTAAQTVIVSLDEIASESRNGSGADANVFLALLGGGADTLDFTGRGWTRGPTLLDVAAGTALPAGAVRLGAAEAALVNTLWNGPGIDPATGLGSGLDLHVFTRGAQVVSIWTDAETVI